MNDILSEEQEGMIKKFVEWIRCDREFAIEYLSQFKWNYEIASDFYWRNFILIY